MTQTVDNAGNSIWRIDPETVAGTVDGGALRGIRKTAVAGFSELAIVAKDGVITDSVTEGIVRTRTFVESFRSLIGVGPHVNVLFSDLSPFTVSYWLDENIGIPLMTRDRQLITAQINLGIAIDPDRPELLLRMMRGRRSISIWDVGAVLQNEMLAKSISVELANLTADEIRGDDLLLRSMYDRVRHQLGGTLDNFGLRLDNFSINWGSTQEQSMFIKELRRNEELRQAKHEEELRRLGYGARADDDGGVDGETKPMTAAQLRSESFQHPITILLFTLAALSGIDLIGLSPYSVGSPLSVIGLGGFLAAGIFSYLLIYSVKSKSGKSKSGELED